ncbi:TagK domain-containing protein [Yersinia hibernica]|uniref:TagK domain-containing protein n=1 Tax=Yersinia hibernica TaxID=2339259 RepID=A0ABX5R3I2_9GAMM|nr:TagK domain-containing protein [Yersinia hibernica]QAX80017.1 TagK domain-containing protein [Yersinia hibernica]
MLLVLTWPHIPQQFQLHDAITESNAICFSMEKGEFTPHSAGDGQNEIRFYRHSFASMIVNHSNDFICMVNGKELTPGEHYPLSLGAEIKFGHFVISAKKASGQIASQSFTDDQLMLEQESLFEAIDLPEIEDILSHGGHYISYLDDVNETLTPGLKEQDALKNLELEYKRFLMWGEQGQKFSEKEQQQTTKLSANDGFLENIRECVKDKTLTECILDSGGLIERVTKELDVTDYLETSQSEEKVDLLKLLAPEHIITKEKSSVPALVFQELYKLGLDSHL